MKKAELLETLNHFANRDISGLGEVLKASSLPLEEPEPTLTFVDQRYLFYRHIQLRLPQRMRSCSDEARSFGRSFNRKSNVLVVGIYATESWKHSAFGNKIITACGWRDKGLPICIVSETHWKAALPASA
jgi:hypothetical protein